MSGSVVLIKMFDIAIEILIYKHNLIKVLTLVGQIALNEDRYSIHLVVWTPKSLKHLPKEGTLSLASLIAQYFNMLERRQTLGPIPTGLRAWAINPSRSFRAFLQHFIRESSALRLPGLYSVSSFCYGHSLMKSPLSMALTRPKPRFALVLLWFHQGIEHLNGRENVMV